MELRLHNSCDGPHLGLRIWLFLCRFAVGLLRLDVLLCRPSLLRLLRLLCLRRLCLRLDILLVIVIAERGLLVIVGRLVSGRPSLLCLLRLLCLRLDILLVIVIAGLGLLVIVGRLVSAKARFVAAGLSLPRLLLRLPWLRFVIAGLVFVGADLLPLL